MYLISSLPISSGTPSSKVHISAATLGYLNGAYEVEPADGKARNSSIRDHNVDTYFIRTPEPAGRKVSSTEKSS